VGRELGVTSHELIDLASYEVSLLKSTSPLIDDSVPVSKYNSTSEFPDGIANTFVPARNILFLTIAANRAVAVGAGTIFTGLCQTDYSGYPDCREEFVKSMEQTLNLGITGEPDSLEIKTPLMHLTKAESVRLAKQVLGEQFEKVMELTTTCYKGAIGGCGECAACLLRDRGFLEAGIEDPILKYRKQAA
jgi:7-cyano-7-deazaguanine synthase